MAADVSSAVRILKGRMEEQQVRGESNSGNSKVLITRDLLGGWSKLGSEELDLDLHVPLGCEKRLDLKSGKVFIQRCNASNSPSSSSSSDQNNSKREQKIESTMAALQDLNYPPSSTTPWNIHEESCLELKLFPSRYYQSVCTLDKVKSALERAEKGTEKKRSSSLSLSSSQSQSSSLMKQEEEEEEKRSSLCSPTFSSSSSAGMFAAGCPGCLLYVLTSKTNPKCPRCGSIVPSPAVTKKPRIDLNATL
ncbi:hypothetical protein L1049_010178 [Liquidambar formosana]|uniref:GIR1-like zinc ribbon domain-containing protein n=1 Tax=Liquidambar formosana TaxID=63359 RepID=A0AAP0N772_LIQFO